MTENEALRAVTAAVTVAIGFDPAADRSQLDEAVLAAIPADISPLDVGQLLGMMAAVTADAVGRVAEVCGLDPADYWSRFALLVAQSDP